MLNSLNIIKQLGKVLDGNFESLSRIKNVHFSTSSANSKNHYETLKLPKNCSTKDIREAFISLSKQYHPDLNKNNPRAQEQFVKVNEAYNVLSKPDSRRDYDAVQFGGYTASPDNSEYYRVRRYQDPQYRDPWKDPSFARNRNFWREEKEQQARDDYYGLKGIMRLSNRDFAFWILVVAGIGLFIQIAIIRLAGVRTLATYDKKSQENQLYLDAVRERAENFGSRETQIEEYKRRVSKITGE